MWMGNQTMNKHLKYIYIERTKKDVLKDLNIDLD